MASIPKGIQNVNSVLPKIWAIMALSRHTDASYIPPFHRTVTRKLTRTQNYYFWGGERFVWLDYIHSIGGKQAIAHRSVDITCKNRYQSRQLASKNQDDKSQKLHEASFMESTDRNTIARTTAMWQQPSRSVLYFLSTRSGRKGKIKNKKKIAAQKQSSLSLKDRKNIPTWNERTDVITARTQLTKEGTTPRQFPIIHPHHSAQLFTSSALLHTPLIWLVR